MGGREGEREQRRRGGQPYFDHGRDWVDSAHVLDDALSEISNTQADGPVGVALQLDHLIGTKTKEARLDRHHSVPSEGLSSSLLPSATPYPVSSFL